MCTQIVRALSTPWVSSACSFPNWTVGEVIPLGRGELLRILAIDDDVDDELVEHGIRAVFTVEPA